MNNAKKYILTAVAKVAEGSLGILGWPPDCAGLFYQPKRVKKRMVSIQETTKDE
jgi:hypothetical protein